MTIDPLTTKAAQPAADASGDDSTPLDDESRQRAWQELMDEYQAEHGPFTEEERARARKALYG